MSDADQTFLELCYEAARECNIPGSGPTTVVGQEGELEHIVRYVQNADLEIKLSYIDWKFLWRDDFSITLSASQQTATSATTGWPSALGIWNPDEFVIDPTADDYQPLDYIDHYAFEREYGRGTHSADTPHIITIKPDNSLAWFPKADGAYTLTGQYWKKPVKMTANSDKSDIPAEFRRLIVVRAKLYYAGNEDAPEVSQDAGAEHDYLLDQLIARYAPSQELKRLHRAPESSRLVVIPQ